MEVIKAIMILAAELTVVGGVSLGLIALLIKEG